MLELKNIKKVYKIGEIETRALNGLNVSFREKEFVAILGTSGSGKTTCLNIIGGLDRYDSGELIIKGKKTSDFKEKDWDAYRNNSIGFVFQNYNLIVHQSIVSNVELGMTLSGVSAAEKRQRALDMLEQVGLKDHLHKKPSQLSGGQMQRVAIARALANNPEILLCDEPTGALDTATSVQIMDLIKKIAKDRLVIMVTHNPNIAEKYTDRIIRFEDGKIISDTNPYDANTKEDKFSLIHTSMSFFTALKLSFSNISTKKGRTFLTSFASSIGIIGIAVILSLSNGFQKQIDKFQSDALNEFPIFITQSASNMNAEDIKTMREQMRDTMMGTVEFADSDEVYLYDPSDTTFVHKNIFTDEYIDYLNNINPEICRSIGYTRIVGMNLLRDVDGTITPVSFASRLSNDSDGTGSGNISSMTTMGLSSYPIRLREGDEPYLQSNYDLLAGEYPQSEADMVLVIDTKNRIDLNTLKVLGFDTEDIESIKFTDIVGTEFKLISNNNYYVKTDFGNYLPSQDYEAMYSSDDSITLRIVGVVRQNEQVTIGLLGSGIAYSDELSKMIIDNAMESDIVNAQKDSDKNVMTMQDIDEDAKKTFLAYLGGDATPYLVMVYPENFEDKDAVLKYLDEYNEGKEIEEQVIYTDMAGSMSSLTGGIMDGITIVLIAFAAISLVVSLIMISIITYTSVLERTKEIGILRALGARKKDITRVFDAETCILGVFSGLLGIGIAYLLTIPINNILYKMTELSNVAQLQITHAAILVALSTVLTMLGGFIPAKIAARKDAVEALRSE
ncbi:MAG: sulfate ABC transporter ATP-binding protein [Clostridiales bacterium GWF2_38_85]|nr:MAG: sulfate ABC transporter ATP-binding protein [Clostridiales bacterium GWF2_38_85]HBL84839.1 sulfate ABC transporter ATP-binding protein [Clostridiales bacterium]